MKRIRFVISLFLCGILLFNVAVPAVKATEGTTVIVDNTDMGFSTGGTWTTSTTLSGYYGTNYRSDGTSGSDSDSIWAKWEFTVSQDGTYDVYMRWTADTNRPDAAPVEISHANGIDTEKTVNQTQNNGEWVYVASYTFEEAEAYYVKLLCTDTGYTVADAVMLELRANVQSTEIIVDNTDDGFITSGFWKASTTLTGFHGTNYISDGTVGADSESTWASWEVDVPANGKYDVYIRWTADTNRPSAAQLQYTFGNDTGCIYLDQRKNGSQWVHLGAYDLVANGVNQLKLYATSDGYTVADAVRFVPTQGFFDDVGVISLGSHQLPSLIAGPNDVLTVVAQDRELTTVSGGHFEKGPADIISLTSTDKGNSWSVPSYIYNKNDTTDGNVCGYSSVLVYNGNQLVCLYTVGPENWATTDLTVYQRTSTDGGITWSTPTAPTMVSDHSNGLPTNGGKGYQHTNGRLILPGRKCLLYSDDNGLTWTATAECADHVETKVVPYYINGNMSLTAILAWRTENASVGKNSRIRIADYYSNNGTNTTTYGSSNNFGLCRYDSDTLLMTVARDYKLYIRTSDDEGVTWSNEKMIMASAPTARYSDIAVLSDGTIVVVFMENEVDGANGAKLRIVKFDMDWLLN